MDFVHDQLATGRKLRILTVVDTHSRYCPAAGARFTYRGEDVVQALEGICRETGYPKTIRVDNVLCVEAAERIGHSSLCTDDCQYNHKLAPDGFHRQRDRSLP